MKLTIVSDKAKAHQAFGRGAIARNISHNSLQFQQVATTNRRGGKS
ncbi:hypothetical protein HNI00_09680 [Thermoleptolyngbya oregonensis NK1-22]|uniref:Uncharacterized protein n=1 Tax=Thermoleptolyngbya oregonensis NK1-22 TaxID=2547457 RepID=A0AA96YB34_9CYAN|nr:hypothetical protein [Leptolyngbya sp. O-77]WOB43400.1 hypothetical protein HNI00_09680 [Thermoleptolyngbya oregonensis NK1-22]